MIKSKSALFNYNLHKQLRILCTYLQMSSSLSTKLFFGKKTLQHTYLTFSVTSTHRAIDFSFRKKSLVLYVNVVVLVLQTSIYLMPPISAHDMLSPMCCPITRPQLPVTIGIHVTSAWPVYHRAICCFKVNPRIIHVSFDSITCRSWEPGQTFRMTWIRCETYVPKEYATLPNAHVSRSCHLEETIS